MNRTPLVVALAAALAGASARAIVPESATAVVSAEALRAHVRFLSSDLLEGRGPATRGDLLARAYIASQMESFGLVPGGADGSWFQELDLVGVRSKNPATFTFKKGDKTLDLRYREDFIASSGVQKELARIEPTEIVFVGYGIVAPEYGWDDYKGADVKGKVLLMLNNDPEDDPKIFEGKTRLYYGRWDYKYEMAAKVGAAGAILIHTTPSAGYPWQVVQTSWTGESFHLPKTSGPETQAEMWVTEDGAKRLAALAGKDLAALVAKAQKKDFAPVPLGVTFSLTLPCEVQRKKSANVLGKVPGGDPALASEVVLFTAHHDHLGMRPDAKPGEDAIYNGAVDNATGVAALLEMARAAKALPTAPKRTLLFAAVAGEEQGLLGSKYLAANPPVPPGKIAADINADAMGIWGRTRDVSMIGSGKSDLDDVVKAIAASQGRTVKPDPFPEKGSYYRSDQLSFARIGVPGVYLKDGVDVIGKPEGWGREAKETFTATHYHQPSDELRADWDFRGMVEDVELLFRVGVHVANTPKLPAWKPGDEFEAARLKALAAGGGARPEVR